MKKNVSFDTLINNIVFTVDYILKDDNSPQKLKDYLYLTVCGFVLNYDDIVEDVYETIDNVIFKFLSDKNTTSMNLFYKNCLDNNYLFKKIDFTKSMSKLDYKYELILDDSNDSPIRILEFLVYQLNTIMFQRKRKVSFGETIMVGIDYLRKEFTTNYDTKENTMCKVFNALQAEDIIKRILELKKFNIKNEKFNNALKLLDDIDSDLYKIEGMDALVNLFRPLYNLNEIKLIVNSFDNWNLLEKEIDSILGKNTYKKTNSKIELLNSMIHLCEKGISHNYYDLSLEYVAIRNDFINKYIKLKNA